MFRNREENKITLEDLGAKELAKSRWDGFAKAKEYTNRK